MRESFEDWQSLGRDLISRGLGAPMLIVAAGPPRQSAHADYGLPPRPCLCAAMDFEPELGALLTARSRDALASVGGRVNPTERQRGRLREPA
jgi:hypothetical protein